MHGAGKITLIIITMIVGVFVIALFVLSKTKHNGAEAHCQGYIQPSKINVSRTITVSQSGDGDFSTVSDAIDHVPSRNKEWVRIFVRPGVYKEKIKIPRKKEFIVLEGSGRSTTTIAFDAHETTSQSPTFAVFSDNFVAKHITFKNSCTKKHIQAVAFRTSGDKHAYFWCGFEGYQDTLWDDKGRHYFDSCYIEGAIDFIWGDARSFYDNCEIKAIGSGFITAQGRNAENDPGGFVFKDCVISGTSRTLLGRAYRHFSTVIFIRSHFGDIISPRGWSLWRRHDQSEYITYAEVDCNGPGSDKSERVKWMKNLDKSQIQMYTREAFIDHHHWIEQLP